jgi:putative nucleotidyltransferase with HDIG domain
MGDLAPEVDDVLFKPVNTSKLQARLTVAQRAMQRRALIDRQRLKIKQINTETIHMFTRLLETYHPALLDHSQRVSAVSLELAQHHPDVKAQEYKLIECAGLLHDLGMITTPRSLFNKRRTEMTGEEREIYLKHAEQGEAIIKEMETLRPVARIVRSHHEQYNGRGFPDGLASDQIPLAAKIVATASIYDNLIHKGRFALEDVPGQLHRLSGYQLDPQIVKLLLEFNRHQIEADAKSIFHEMRLEQIAEGMVLAKNVRLRSGALAMPLHTRITAGTIEKLQQYRNKDHIADKFYVYKS